MPRGSARRQQGGFTYLLLLFAVAAMGLLLAAAGEVWQTSLRREKETELLFVGNAYRQAIASYFENAQGESKQYPRRLSDLLEDPRAPVTKRHLRKLYADPITGDTEWGLVKTGDRISGVYSLSDTTPVKRHFNGADESFSGAARYSDWIFSGATAPP